MKHIYTRKCYLIKHPWHAALKLRQEVVSIIHSLSVYRQYSIGVLRKGGRTSATKSPLLALVLLLYLYPTEGCENLVLSNAKNDIFNFSYNLAKFTFKYHWNAL